jgi:integrase
LAVEKYRNDSAQQRLSGKTVGQHIRSLSALWNKARADGLISDRLPNPFSGHKVHHDPRPRVPQELSLEELHAIFALPVFTEGERPPRLKGEAAYWVPLLLLFTGARPGEIAQLLVSDVVSEGNHWFIDITTEGEAHPEKGPKTLKTKRGGARRVAVHPELMRLGFIKYVQHLQASGERALFPGLKQKGKKDLIAGFSEGWSKYLKDQGAFPKGDGRRGLREFRQNWATAAIKSGLHREVREYLMGHSPSGKTAHDQYGDRTSWGLQMLEVRYDGLELSSVKPWEPQRP